MGDVFAPAIRSIIMSKIRSSGNASTELRLKEIFKAQKITGWRRNFPLYGKPDFVFPKKRIVVFVDGCFWHGHDCKDLKPKSNLDYWNKKIGRNQNRDKFVSKILRSKKWRVIRIWECAIKQGALSSKVRAQIKGQ